MSLASAFKGWFGESLLAVASMFALDGDTYRAVNNATLTTSNGTTQIDHIIVSRYGVFVIETKNMEGWIFGTETQSKWTQSLGRTKFQFQNPLHQNYRHIKALEEFLNLPASVFHSVVCFVGKACELKTALPENVILGGPFRYIKSKTLVLLPDERVPEIVAAIKNGLRPKNFLGLSTGETKREHLASLTERHSSTTICPKCGGELVMRAVRRGDKAGQQFYGCNKYPACRFTRPLTGTQ
jgi:restriction system protein